MVKEIFGKKLGMTQLFDEAGDVHAVTLVEVEPALILEKVDYPTKSVARIGCFKVSTNKVKKPVLGYFNRLGVDTYKLIREVEIESDADFSFLEKKEEPKQEVKEEPVAEAKEAPAESVQETSEAPEANSEESGPKEEAKAEEVQEPAQEAKEQVPEEDAASQEETKEETKEEEPKVQKNPRQIGIDLFNVGDILDVRAKTKGRGFAGGMKKHNWAGQPSAHGSTMHRRIGSAGMCAFPGEILKGTRMPGHMGDVPRTTKNLKVIRIDADKNVLFIEGSIPGAKGTVVKLKRIKSAS